MLNGTCPQFERAAYSSNSQVSVASSGLFGFGLSAIFLNLLQTGLFSIDISLLAMGVFYGGVSQITVGLVEWHKNNTFGAITFVSFGLFWLSLVGFIILPEAGWGVVPQATVLSAYFFLWGAFTLILVANAIQLSFSVRMVFLMLVVYFIAFALGQGTGSPMIQTIANYCGFAAGGAALYAAVGQISRQVFGRSPESEENSR